jgi:2',3'-cyclic-nucleotide 2'-phosphodiesterase/3'-nucleotidase
MGYEVAAIGNHEFDKGQEVLQERIAQSNFPWVSANIVLEGTEWDHPDWIQPYVILNKGGVNVGIIGVTTDETPQITLKGTTEGLVFKDLTEAILHYYDEVMAQADALIVLAHMGTNDSGPYKGLQTVAQELIDAGKPVDLMIAGHQHQYLAEPVWVGNTAIIEDYKYGRTLGRADITIDPSTKSITLDHYELITINNQLPADPDIEARVAYWAEVVAPFVEQPVGTTMMSLTRDYNNESIMGDLVTDGMLWKADQYDDGEVNGSVDIAFTNPGGLRADIEVPVGATLPFTITWGDTFNVMPFGNTLYLMDLTGAQIQELLDQAATLYKGILQSSGVTWYWYNDCGCDTPTAWGAYNIKVNGEPLDRDKVYRVVTNNFLAGGQDGWVTFAEGTNRWDTYYDMQEAVNEYIATISPIEPEDIPGGRITRLDNVVTILHTNDTHGRWEADTYRGNPNGFAYLASLIERERTKNPNVLLLDAGDTIQGNAFAFYFRNRTPNPIIEGMNLLNYDAMVLGNHEFNFGSETLLTAMTQADFPILGANVEDDGRYGLDQIPVQDYIVKDANGVEVAILGITNPRVPRYEMPLNIEGLTFSGAYETAEQMVPQIRSTEDPDLLVALTHIGFSGGADPQETDTAIAEGIPGIDVIIGGHSHSRLDPAVMITSDANPEGTLVAQAYKYATYLGVVNVGFLDGEIAFREGYLVPASEADPDPEMETFLAPFVEELDAYTGEVIGETLTDLDALDAYTEETGAANLQVDATKWAAEQAGYDVDFHLSGAMSNKFVPAGELTVGDMFYMMPYENALVVYRLNGPQIKTILERSYWNWWHYMNYTWQELRDMGISKYTTCFLDISEGGRIMYDSSRPPEGNNVIAVWLNGQLIDLNDETTYYNVSTVNYVGAGSCNFRDEEGNSLWPIENLIAAPQLYVRESVIDYVREFTPIAPQVEGRLLFRAPEEVAITPAAGMMGYVDSLNRLGNYLGSGYLWTGQDTRPHTPRYLHGVFQFDLGALPADAVITGAEVSLTQRSTRYAIGESTYSLNLLPGDLDGTFSDVSYWAVHNATPEATLDMGMVVPGVGTVDTATFDVAAVSALQDRLLTTGKASFRLDGTLLLPYGRDVLGWDGRADGGAPVLRVTYYAP